MNRVFPLRQLGLGFVDGDGVVPAKLVEAMTDADLILVRARDEAAAILAEATAAHEAERRRGLAEGKAQAEAEAVVWMQDARRELEMRLDRIQMELADVVTACVRRIVLSFDDRQLAIDTVRSALAALRSEKRVQLHVAASAEAHIRAALPSFLADYPEMQLIDVIVDPQLDAPDARLESELGVVTFRLEETLADLGRLLRGGQEAT